MPTVPTVLRLMLLDVSGDAARAALDEHQAFAEKRFPIRDGSVEMRVIGASSIILVQTSGMALAEVIACGEIPPVVVPLVEVGVSLTLGPEGHGVHTSQALRYDGRIRTFALKSGEGPKRVASLPHFLEHRFSSEGSPLTDIDGGEDSERRLMFRTWHEYPELGIYVRSGSMWEFR